MIEDKRAAAVPVTTRMIEFLRDLSSASITKVRDVTAYDEVLWLADLPAQVTPFYEATNGDVLLSFEAVPSEPPPPSPREPERLGGRRGDPHQRRRRPRPRGARPHLEREMAADDWAYLAVLYGLEDGWSAHSGRGGRSSRGPQRMAHLPRQLAAVGREDRRTSSERHWHGRLARIAHLLTQQDDRLELVIATGLLTWLTQPETACATTC